MKLNTLIKTIAIAAGLSASSMFALPTVVLTRNGFDGIPDAGGGEFKATTTNNGTFLTFCLEKNINVSPGSTYNYTIDPVALSGGPDTHDVGTGDPVSFGTAWLYNHFIAGNLVDGFDGVGFYAENRDYNAGLLQLAIWQLEDEMVWNPAGNYYVNLVNNIFQDARAADTGSDIKVMNLWTLRAGDDVQSVLFKVPDGATTSLLFGFGLISLALLRRKL